MKVLYVFVNEKGQFGNPVGIILDTKDEISTDKRQKIAAESGFSEAVFVNDLDTNNISIYSPQREIPFAGHALVGASYFLSQEYKKPITQLVGIGGVISTWQKDSLTWIRGKLSITPPWNYEQLQSPSEVDSFSPEQTSLMKHTVVWAWKNKEIGIIRARPFDSKYAEVGGLVKTK